jgi:hypothetical protein
VTEDDGGFGCRRKAQTTVRLNRKKCLSGCAGDRGKEGNQRESTELSVPGVFHRRWPDLLQHSGGKLHGLAASFQRGKERDERGGVGDL